VRIANQYKQNTKEWYEWRKGGLGASDAPIIMSVSPFQSRFELWAVKIGLMERPEFHPRAIEAMTRGKLLEDEARECYEKKVGVRFEKDVNVIHPTHDFIRASLDGYNAQYNRIVEVKCPGATDLKEAAMGRVPKKYLPQVQLQLLVTGAVACDYFTYDGKDGKAIEVLPDPVYQQSLEKEMIAFWRLVQEQKPPYIEQSDLDKLGKTLDKYCEKYFTTYDLKRRVDEMFQQQNKKGDNNDQLGETRKGRSHKRS